MTLDCWYIFEIVDMSKKVHSYIKIHVHESFFQHIAYPTSVRSSEDHFHVRDAEDTDSISEYSMFT